MEQIYLPAVLFKFNRASSVVQFFKWRFYRLIEHPPEMEMVNARLGIPPIYKPHYSLIKKKQRPRSNNGVAVKNIPDKALFGTPGTTRTYDLRIRSPLLYPAELQARMVLLVFG